MVANAGDFNGDTMQGQANHLAQGSLNLRQQFAEPQGWEPGMPRAGVGGAGSGRNMVDGEDVPSYYNQHASYPKKFAIPTQQKERLQAREEVRASVPAGTGGVQRTDPITDEAVNY